MTTVALVVHPDHPEAHRVADQAEQWLAGHGHGVVRIDAAAGGDDVARAPLGEGVDLAVSLGGDGTMLRTVALACPGGVPVLGVNLGRLGYLTEVEPSGLQGALERFLAGDHGIEERVTLEVDVESKPAPEADDGVTARADTDRPRPMLVLNEAVVEKTVPGHTVRVRASIGGRPLVTYAADGLLVATPTGSTAYNLSAHGPILSPGLRALVLTPVSPHMLFDRPVVLEPEQWVRLEVGGPRPAVLVLDGQTQQVLQPGDAVVCRVGPMPARFVTFGPRDFFAILRARFHLADR